MSRQDTGRQSTRTERGGGCAGRAKSTRVCRGSDQRAFGGRAARREHPHSTATNPPEKECESRPDLWRGQRCCVRRLHAGLRARTEFAFGARGQTKRCSARQHSGCHVPADVFVRPTHPTTRLFFIFFLLLDKTITDTTRYPRRSRPSQPISGSQPPRACL